MPGGIPRTSITLVSNLVSYPGMTSLVPINPMESMWVLAPAMRISAILHEDCSFSAVRPAVRTQSYRAPVQSTSNRYLPVLDRAPQTSVCCEGFRVVDFSHPQPA
jgi:hypothetical protein